MELEVKWGLRKPCYRTIPPSTATASVFQHEASFILQVESIGDCSNHNSCSNSGESLFVSLGANGVLIFWTTKVFSSSSSDNKSDMMPGLSVWGQLALLPIRKVNSDENSSVRISSSLNSTYIGYPVFAIIPGGDSLSVYVSTGNGEVCCVNRLGHDSHFARRPLRRNRTNTDSNITQSEVTSISVYACLQKQSDLCETSTLLESGCLVLVGRRDGSVDLFIDNDTVAYCLHTWDTLDFKTSTKQMKSVGHSTNAIVGLQWCPRRPSVFIATARDETVFCFDLLVDLFSPVTTSVLPMQSSGAANVTSSNGRLSQLLLVDITCTAGDSRRSGVTTIVTGFENKFRMHTVQARQLSSHLTRPNCITDDELLQEEKALRRRLATFIIL